MRAQNRRPQRFRSKTRELGGLSEKYKKGVKKRPERYEWEGDSSFIAWTVRGRNDVPHLGPHILWITL